MKRLFILFSLIFALPAFITASPVFGENKSNSKTFISENDTLIQTLNVTFREKNNIYFEFTVKNKQTSKEEKLSGVAKASDQDPEIDEDEEGMAYMATQYIYRKGDCWLYIRIDGMDRSKAQTEAADCSSGLSFTSVAVMRPGL